MPPSRLCRDEDGSAALEFLVTGILLLVPIVYLVLVVSALQAGSFGVEGAARQAARVFVEAATPEQALTEARRSVDISLRDYGLDATAAKVSISCMPDGQPCLTRGSYVTVSITSTVPLPLVPAGIAVTVPLTVPMSASATDQVSQFWGAG